MGVLRTSEPKEHQQIRVSGGVLDLPFALRTCDRMVANGKSTVFAGIVDYPVSGPMPRALSIKIKAVFKSPDSHDAINRGFAGQNPKCPSWKFSMRIQQMKSFSSWKSNG
jgi:hypothetical protein